LAHEIIKYTVIVLISSDKYRCIYVTHMHALSVAPSLKRSFNFDIRIRVIKLTLHTKL
jgi:hypothetical protein